MKLCRQLAAITLLILLFVFFDLGIYHVFTKRCISDYSEEMQAKSIEIGRYLPFVEDSQIVKLESDVTLRGDLPVIDGAAALFPVYSAFVNAFYPEDSVRFDGETFAAESAMQYSNTRGAYKAVVDGTVDIAILAAPSQEQQAYAASQGRELVLVPIGREAFVFLVHANNPVESLTTEQIRGIYSGQYKNWAELGGENRRIGALQRNEGSGSQTAMLQFMNGEPIKRDYDIFLGSAIGYSFRYYVEDIVGERGVKMLAVDGIYPSAENITNSSYPLVSEFYAVYCKDNENENIPLFIEQMLSEEGQEIVARSGYVSIR